MEKENILNFSSVEEVKDFLSDADNRKVIGVICFLGPNGQQMSKTVDELINDIGIDKVSQFIYESKEKFEVVSIEKSEIPDLIKKSKKAEDLTEEEKRKLEIINTTLTKDREDVEEDFKVLFNAIILFMEIYTDIGYPFDTLGGLFSSLLTFSETTILLNTPLKKYLTNTSILDAIIDKAVDSIQIEEGIAPELAVLGLLHNFGLLLLNNFGNVKIDIEELKDMLDLEDTENMFNKILPLKDGILKEDVLNDIFNHKDNKHDDIFKSLEDEFGLNFKNLESKNGSNKDSISDIRKRLKNDD